MARKKSETAVLGFRVKEPLRRKIEMAAKSNGVSMNSELVRRVEGSFASEDAKASAYGGAELDALFRMLGGVANFVEFRTGKLWTVDWHTSLAVKAAWKKLIAQAMPPSPDEFKEVFATPEPKNELTPLPERPTPSYPGGLLGEPEIDVEKMAEYDTAFARREKEVATRIAELKERSRQFGAIRAEVLAFTEIGTEAANELFPPRVER